jgi:alanine-glyoxylate transaminase/serine-glyoxylate transaminase/serine-pyruvate transaminase
MCYALREALELVKEEGLAKRWARHREVAEVFWKQIEALGLEMLVAHDYRLPTLTTIKVPPGIDSKKVVTYILERFEIEIGNGLGELAGKAWRIGLMGCNARHDIALLIVAALKEALQAQGYKVPPRARL